MLSLNFKKNLLSLSIPLFLIGCKEAEIKGEWINPEGSFNKSYIVSLITSADQNLTSKDIEVSELESSGNDHFFYVTLVDKGYTQEQLESLVSNVERLKDARNTNLTVNFTNIANAKDASERDLLNVVQRAGMEKNGSQSTSLNWEKAEVSVYTQKISITGYTDPYSDFNPKVYCQLTVPLTKRLNGFIIDKPFPYITSHDIPENIASAMSPTQLDKYIKDENGLRRYVNVGLELKGATYPHKTVFGDGFLTKFKESNDILTQSLPMTYNIDAQSIYFNFGDIPNTEVVSGLNDFGGVIHDKCAKLIKQAAPEIDKKWSSAVQLARVGRFTINPEWIPQE